MQVPRFLQLLHGELALVRLQAIEEAFVGLGGDPQSEESAISPAALKERFHSEAHPLVVRGDLDAQSVVAEFLDTFSLLAHVRGGCQNGMVSFLDFLAYYEVVSSMVENDAFFKMLMKRLWSDSVDDAQRPMTGGMPAQDTRQQSPREKREQAGMSPMAQPRPPVHNGPSAYATSTTHPVDQQHRRFLRKEMPGVGGGYGDETQPPPAPAMSAYSPITKSSIVFNESDSSELGIVICLLRDSVAKRGLRGWKALSQKFMDFDHRKNGGIMKLDWERIHKTLGLGLSPEEREALFKGVAAGRKDGAMDYRQCLRRLRGNLSDERRVDVEALFETLKNDDGLVSTAELKDSYQPQNTPHCMLSKKDVQLQYQEFCDAVDFFGGQGGLDLEAFSEFFSIVSAIHPEEDEFRLMTTAVFGLPH